MASSSSSSSFFSILLLIFLISATATFKPAATSTTTTKIPLSKPPNHPTKSPWEALNLAAKASRIRACHLKRIANDVKLPSYPRSYGGYSISLSLGSPPQRTSLVLDTGSSLVWTPCTTSYACQNCSFSGVDPLKLPIYTPNTSSTSLPVSCTDPKCGWVFGSGTKCTPKTPNCPFYQLEYGLGDTSGQLFCDTLGFSGGGNPVPGFLFGCSVMSNRQPEGIAGFGRGLESVPAQLRLNKFSYCLASHQFDDEGTHSGDLILYQGRDAGDTQGVSYAPFVKSPAVAPYSEYYYVSLDKFIVGGNVVQIPAEYLTVSANGNGGVIVDSGSTFTYMERAIFDPVANELEKQMSKYMRAPDVEDSSGLGPCYNITGQDDVEVPKLVLLFNGGAKMDLPLGDYFEFVNGPSIVCMTVLTDPEGPVGPGVPSGPAMILGNNQQQNFYVEFDLVRQRFGFKTQQCDQSS